jgi:hypothetical protein
MGSTAAIGEGFQVSVNSVEPNVQLSPVPPAGYQYFAANVTLRYSGTGSVIPDQALDWHAQGFGNGRIWPLHPSYTADAASCGNPGPQPALDVLDPVSAGQSISGYVCWTIEASDAKSLTLFFGSGNENYPGTTWFKLH